MKKLLVSAIEPSANLHLINLLDRLKKEDLSLQIGGIFDSKLGNSDFDSGEFNVMGFLDVIPKILKAKKIIKELAILSLNYDKVLLIDAPSFNIPLAKAIKKINPKIVIIYYILPKVWVWKKNRIKVVERWTDIQASIFPFEKLFFKNSIYVGNPLNEEIKESKTEVTENGVIAFLAGSRKSEIKALMEIFREVAKKIDKQKILVIPPHFTTKEIDEIYGDITQFEISKNTHRTLLKSDFAFICSGTATLESALIGTPFVLVYIAKKFDAFIVKTFIDLKFAGLANIILDYQNKPPLHKEFLQEKVTVKNLLAEYENLDKEKFIKSSMELKNHLEKRVEKELFRLLI